MDKNIKKFSIDDLELFENDDSQDFAIAKIYFISDGNNGQNSPIPTEVLKRDANTVLGKFVVAQYHEFTGDVGTHELTETIVGYCPADSHVGFEEKDGKLFAVCEVVISKIYATQVYELFKSDNERAVSCEFSCTQENSNSDGEGTVTSFVIHGITILGKSVLPAVDGANIKIMKFAKDKAEDYYEEYSSENKLKAFAKKRKDFMNKALKVNKTELKDDDWGNVDKAKLRDAIINAPNGKSIVHDAYMLVEKGWEDNPSECLKYPVMQLIGNTLYYNKGGLSLALGYAKTENETEVINKVEKIYNKLNIDRKDNEKDMAEIKGKDTKEEKDTKPTNIDAKADTADKDKNTEKKDFADNTDKKDKEKVAETTKDVPTDKKDEKEVKDGKGADEKAQEFKDKDTKKMSLDVNVDNGAMFAMLEKETEQNKKMATDLYDSKDMNIIMGKVLSLAKENDALKAEKAKRDEKDKEFAVNKIMADVKSDLNDKEFEELKKKGMSCDNDKVETFANEVKAFAYEKSKGKASKEFDDGIMRFSAFNNDKADVTNVFDKILND